MLILAFLTSVSVTVAPTLVDEYCIGMGELAEAIMTGRQRGHLQSDFMTVDHEITRYITPFAYDEPRRHSPELQEEAILNFRIYWESLCYEAVK